MQSPYFQNLVLLWLCRMRLRQAKLREARTFARANVRPRERRRPVPAAIRPISAAGACCAGGGTSVLHRTAEGRTQNSRRSRRLNVMTHVAAAAAGRIMPSCYVGCIDLHCCMPESPVARLIGLHLHRICKFLGTQTPLDAPVIGYGRTIGDTARPVVPSLCYGARQAHDFACTCT